MGQLVVLNLGRGNLQQGLPTVLAQLWVSPNQAPMQFTGSLPAAPELEALYLKWRSLYEVLCSTLSWRGLRNADPNNPFDLGLDDLGLDEFDLELDVEETDVTNVSLSEFKQICWDLQHQINAWLDTQPFRPIDRHLRTRLNPADEVRLIITSEDDELLRLPWCLWHFLEDYPNAEIAVSPLEYRRSHKVASERSNEKVRILAILGSQQGIDVESDQRLLQQLPHAEIQFLVEPDRATLGRQFWEQGWDILFFAGHSASQKFKRQSGAEQGIISINATDHITVEQLKYGLKRAIAHNLRLAIFNSCDGLGIAQDLADLQIPQVIVMREPVPDRVAQEFLKYFLTAFASGQSLYTSVREARERLQPLEAQYPCATWLPVICQNPAEASPLWQEWYERGGEFLEPDASPIAPPKITPPDTEQPVPVVPKRSTSLVRQWASAVSNSAIIAGLIIGVRWLGLFEPMELWAFDRLMRLRPYEAPDSRIVVVTIDESDILLQGQADRRGSISDATLDQLLAKLDRSQARVIGLDIYRDYPASSLQTNLINRLQYNDRLIAVCKGRDAQVDQSGVSPPPEVPRSRVGFSDFLTDQDGILRRQLLFMEPDPISPCAVPYSFNNQIVFRYLKAEGIEPTFTREGNLQLGQAVFPRLNNRAAAAYQNLDAGGGQILLNYRALPAPDRVASQVSLTQVLSGQVAPNAFRDRVVLVGVTAASSSDYWATPYGADLASKTAGVLIQAQMVSQMLSAVLDGRSLLWFFPEWGEGIWILGWAVFGGILTLGIKRIETFILVEIFTLAALSGVCFVLLIQGGWVPYVPAALALGTAGCRIIYIRSKNWTA